MKLKSFFLCIALGSISIVNVALADAQPLNVLAPIQIAKVIQGISIQISPEGNVLFQGRIPNACVGAVALKALSYTSNGKTGYTPVVFGATDACLKAAQNTTCLFPDEFVKTVNDDCSDFVDKTIHLSKSGKLLCRQINSKFPAQDSRHNIDMPCIAGEDDSWENPAAKQENTQCNISKNVNPLTVNASNEVDQISQINKSVVKDRLSELASLAAKANISADIKAAIDTVEQWSNDNFGDAFIQQKAKALLASLFDKACANLRNASKLPKGALNKEFSDATFAAVTAIQIMKDGDMLTSTEASQLSYSLSNDQLSVAIASGDSVLFQAVYQDWLTKGASLKTDSSLRQEYQSFLKYSTLHRNKMGWSSSQAQDDFMAIQATKLAKKY